MKRFLPYFNLKNLRRIFSWEAIRLDDESHSSSKPSLPPVSISLDKADPQVLEHFGLLAASCCRAPFAFSCGLDGNAVWRHSSLPIAIESVRTDLLAHLRQSAATDVGEVHKPAPPRSPDEKQKEDGTARFAAFAPLRTRSGELIGALCVLDDRERTLGNEEKFALKITAAQMTERLELQKQADQFAHCQEAVESVLHFFQNHKTRGTRDVFLPFLARHLAGLAEVERVFIAEISPERPKVARAVAVCFQGARVENFDYPLPHSPFESVASRHVCCHERDVLKQFPGDEYLRSISASGYAGISLLDSTGKLNGVIVFVDRNPLKNTVILESILVILASRVAAELENRRLENALGISESRYQNIYEHAADGIYQLSADDRYTNVNPAMALILGYSSPTELIQQVASVARDVYADPSRRADTMARLRTEGEVYDPECRAVCKDGRHIWISEKLRAIRDSQGSLLHYAGVVKDITALKEAEESCALLQSRFHTVFEQSSLGVALMDDKGVITQSNPALDHLLAFPADELRGRSIASLCHPDDLQACARLQTECLTGRRAIGRLEMRCLRKDKNLVWVALTISAANSSNGSVQSMVMMLQDLTEHRQVEEALAQSRKAVQAGNARFNALSDCAEVGVVTMEHTGRITHSNPALENLLGYSRSELQTKSWGDLMHPDDWKTHEARLIECLDGSRPHSQVEGRFLRKTGEIILGRLTISSAPGDPQDFVGVIEDLTAHKRTEENLRASNQRFQAMFEGAAIGVAMLDREGRLTQANHSLAQWLGFPREEILSKPLSDFIHPADAAKVLQAHQESVTGKRDYHQTEKRFTRKDRSTVWARLTTTIVRGTDGSFQYAIAMWEDVTARVEKEKALLAVDAPLQLLLEHAQTGVAFTSPQGRITHANAVLQKFLGCSREELLSRPVVDFLHPDDRKEASALLDAWLGGKRVDCRIEARFQDREHRPVWLRATFSAIRSQDQSPHYGVALFEDISGTKSLNEKVASSDTHFHAIFDQPGIGAALIDHKGRFLQANPFLRNLLGFSIEELNFKSFADFTHPDDLAEYKRLLSDCAESRAGFEVEHRYAGQDGRSLWGRLCMASIPGTPEMVATLQDITPRKQIEEAFARGESRFQVLLDGAPTGIALLDRDGHILRINALFAEMVDSSASALVGQSFLDLAHAEQRPQLVQFHSESLENKSDRFQIETRMIRKDHSLIWTRVTLSAMRQSDHSGPHAIAIVENIAPRREAELALADVREKLRQAEEKIQDADARQQQTSQKLSGTDRELDEKSEALAVTRDTVHALEGKLHAFEENLHALEENLKASEARYRSLFHQPGMGVASLDDHGRFIEANAALESLLGFSHGELATKSLANLVHPDDLNTLAATQAECTEGKKDHFQVQLRLLNKHAEEIWARLTGSILHGKQDAPPITLILVEDITARVVSEELSHINHARFEALCQHTGAGVVLCDEHDRITYVNHSLEHLLDLSHDDLVSKAMSELVHPSDPNADHHLHAECLDGKRDHYEVEKCLKRRDQNPVWTRATTSIVRSEDGFPRYSIRVFEDITARRASESAREGDERTLRTLEFKLRSAEEKLREMERRTLPHQNGNPSPAEEAPSALPVPELEKPRAEKKEPLPYVREEHFHEMIHAFITVDLEDNIVHINPCAEELLSCKHAAVFGKKLDDIFAVQRQRPLRTMSRISDDSPQAGFGLTKSWVKRSDGTERIYLQNSSSLLDDGGIVVGRVIVFQDFESISKLEQELIESNQLPSHAIFDEQLAHEFDNVLAILGMLSNPLIASFHKQPGCKDGWEGSFESVQKQSEEIQEKLLLLSGGTVNA